ncbi:4-hydroxyphenylacetate 3-hydroxylase C-terminal domain-containing protein [Candidatus Poriferisodalis sp.]|uniref:4-hydroxyphenylacetate 3-hydroxylase C-terminal domain-containing protein n=1 Tax=Candidatus Poriferisodalis sp. TaxID=3101277 RepID=UPI003B520F9C
MRVVLAHPLRRSRCRPIPAPAGEYRARLMHTIRDLTADSYGDWKFVTNLQAGGGLYAQRIVTRRHYDLEGAKQKALAVAGLSESAH